MFLGRIGITLDAFWAEPKNEINEEDKEAAERYLQMHVSIHEKLIKKNYVNFIIRVSNLFMIATAVAIMNMCWCCTVLRKPLDR